MLKANDYDIELLGERKKCIPGHEPILNKKEEVIPVCEPDLSEETLINVSEAITSNWISSRGKYLDEFEKTFAYKVGSKYAIAVNSGTSALHLALAGLGIKPGDEIIVPAFTMISTAFAASYLGAVPIFVDCDEYYQIDVKLIEDKITPKTKAILPVHIFGHPVNMDKIEAFGIPVIYDAAESHGALYKGEPIGGRGVASCYSFYGNKIITCFPAGTSVLVKPVAGRGKSRARKIEDIQVDQEVLSYNTETSQKEYKKVVATQEHFTDENLVVVSFSNDNKLEMTPEHPLFVVGKGWVEAKGLTIGDKCIQYVYRGLSNIEVAGATRKKFSGKVYNLTVADNNNYFTKGILVHNCGEGGMITTNNKEFADLVRNLKDVSFSTERHFWHKRLGYNFRMTNLAAAVGVSQVKRFNELVQKHKDNAQNYMEALKDIEGLRLPISSPDVDNVFWMFGFEVEPEFGMTRDQLRKFLADRGIESRTFFVPMHLQPYYQRLNEHYPVSERLSERGMYLPSSSKLTPEQLEKVVDAIKQAHESVR